MARAFFFSFFNACLCGVALAAPVQQSISTSRQFVVYGTDVEVRGAICDLAERTKHELLGVLGQRDNWTTAIVINARYAQANLPELPRLQVDLSQTGAGLKLQLDLVIDPAVSRPEIRRELLRALLLELMYRGEPQLPPGAVYASPPDWLLDGVPSVQSDLSRDRAAALLASSSESGNVWPLHKFLAQRSELLDGSAKNLYRAYSCALVELLSQSRDGARRLTQFVLDLPRAPNDPMADLREHFPEIFGSESAETIWQRQVSRFSRDQPYQLLSSAETERRLAEMLRLGINDADSQKTYDLNEFPVFQRNKKAKNALVALGNNLTALATRAHPVYAPIISEYIRVVALLRRGATLDVPKRLDQLAVARREMAAQMRAIDDYLNWFEATSLAGPSGQFAGYMKAAERAEQPGRTKRDPISVYLDALEEQLENDKPTIR